MDLHLGSTIAQSDFGSITDFIGSAIGTLGDYAVHNPALTIFVVLCLGHLIGRIRIAGFSIGDTMATLVIGLIISALSAKYGVFQVGDLLKTISFSIFVFAIGYESGPAIMRNLDKNCLKVVALGIIYGLFAFFLALLLFKIFNIGAAEGAGILGGSVTQSAILASAGARLPAELQNRMAVAYALTYVFGTLLTCIFMRRLSPLALRVNLKDAAVRKRKEKSEPDRKEDVKPPVQFTNPTFLYSGLMLGLLIGLPYVTIKSASLTLGAGGGSLIAGFILGAIHQKHDMPSQLPPAVSKLMKDLGLNLFIACVGLEAGANFFNAVVDMGFKPMLIGMCITLVPMFAASLTGKYILRMNPVDIVGGLSGASTCCASIDGVIKDTGENIFMTSFIPGYAVGNIVLTMLGPLLIAFMS